MKIKLGVDIHDVRPETVIGMLIVDGYYKSTSNELTVTSVKDGTHMPNSFHYSGLAFDCRLPITPIGVSKDWLSKTFVPGLRSSLGYQWDVLLEETHIHVEFDQRP